MKFPAMSEVTHSTSLVFSLLLVSSLLNYCFCLFENHPRIKAITTIEHLYDIRSGVEDNRLAIIAIWHEDDLNVGNEVVEAELSALEASHQGYFSVHHMDCDFFP